MNKKILIFLSGIFLFSCSKNSDFLNLNPEPQNRNTFSLTEVDSGGEVDILWVVDNSGSMSGIQKKVKDNLTEFMALFTSQTNLRWKMGLISTDKEQKPFLGFEKPFDYNSIDPVDQITNAMTKLGKGGSDTEISFYTVNKQLNNYPDFLRKEAHFFVIYVTDEVEQSFEMRYTTDDYMSDMKTFVSSYAIFRNYGVLNFKGVGSCGGPTYSGSEFQQVIEKTEGFAIPACKENFAKEMLAIGEDIISVVIKKNFLLKQKPIIDSIRVYYKGIELPFGPEEDGGVWYYDDQMNSVNLYHTGFVSKDEKIEQFLEIEFDVDEFDF